MIEKASLATRQKAKADSSSLCLNSAQACLVPRWLGATADACAPSKMIIYFVMTISFACADVFLVTFTDVLVHDRSSVNPVTASGKCNKGSHLSSTILTSYTFKVLIS